MADSIAVGSFVSVPVTQNVGAEAKSVKAVVLAIDGETANLHIPGWDYAAETPNHIYGVAPFANGVPLNTLSLCTDIPETLEVVCTSDIKHRVAGTFVLEGVFESDIDPDTQTKLAGTNTIKVARPKWIKKANPEVDGDKDIYLVFKAQKKKPSWLFCAKEQLNMDGGYALLAQDIWTPDLVDDIQRSEVWGSWSKTQGKWVADNTIKVTKVA